MNEASQASQQQNNIIEEIKNRVLETDALQNGTQHLEDIELPLDYIEALDEITKLDRQEIEEIAREVIAKHKNIVRAPTPPVRKSKSKNRDINQWLINVSVLLIIGVGAKVIFFNDPEERDPNELSFAAKVATADYGAMTDNVTSSLSGAYDTIVDFLPSADSLPDVDFSAITQGASDAYDAGVSLFDSAIDSAVDTAVDSAIDKSSTLAATPSAESVDSAESAESLVNTELASLEVAKVSEESEKSNDTDAHNTVETVNLELQDAIESDDTNVTIQAQQDIVAQQDGVSQQNLVAQQDVSPTTDVTLNEEVPTSPNAKAIVTEPLIAEMSDDATLEGETTETDVNDALVTTALDADVPVDEIETTDTDVNDALVTTALDANEPVDEIETTDTDVNDALVTTALDANEPVDEIETTEIATVNDETTQDTEIVNEDTVQETILTSAVEVVTADKIETVEAEEKVETETEVTSTTPLATEVLANTTELELNNDENVAIIEEFASTENIISEENTSALTSDNDEAADEVIAQTVIDETPVQLPKAPPESEHGDLFASLGHAFTTLYTVKSLPNEVLAINAPVVVTKTKTAKVAEATATAPEIAATTAPTEAILEENVEDTLEEIVEPAITEIALQATEAEEIAETVQVTETVQIAGTDNIAADNQSSDNSNNIDQVAKVTKVTAEATKDTTEANEVTSAETLTVGTAQPISTAPIETIEPLITVETSAGEVTQTEVENAELVASTLVAKSVAPVEKNVTRITLTATDKIDEVTHSVITAQQAPKIELASKNIEPEIEPAPFQGLNLKLQLTSIVDLSSLATLSVTKFYTENARLPVPKDEITLPVNDLKAHPLIKDVFLSEQSDLVVTLSDSFGEAPQLLFTPMVVNNKRPLQWQCQSNIDPSLLTGPGEIPCQSVLSASIAAPKM